jgi:chromosome segregation ATPase
MEIADRLYGVTMEEPGVSERSFASFAFLRILPL